jgi:hypothetical protein
VKNPYLKIRGIYATALTRLCLDMGYGITESSPEIRGRFGISEDEADQDVSIYDRDDRQGIRIMGSPAVVENLVHRLWETLLDMVVRHASEVESGVTPDGGQPFFDIEFPGASKAALDGLRSRVLPTVKDHHRMRIFASDSLDLVEQQIQQTPDGQKKLERELIDRSLYRPLRKHGVLRFEHVKPEGQEFELREGEIVSLSGGSLLVKRRFHQGHYDGLDLAIKPGDYGITEVTPNAWFLRHRYFTKTGEFRGEYININTPIELYPDRIRYVDLHVDVVRRMKEAPRIIDEHELKSITDRGLISKRLREKAIEVCHHLVDRLEISDPGSSPQHLAD